MGDRNEFITGWPAARPSTWISRSEDDMIGSSKGGHLFVPTLNVFDYIEKPNAPVVILTAPSNRAYVDAPRGTAAMFHRNVDFDTLHFQMAGQTVYETEFGTYASQPGEVLLVPAGISFRVTGLGQSLRQVMLTRDPLDVKINAHVGHTEYDVVWEGAPEWPTPQESALYPKGRVTESVHTWEDEPGDETLIDRDYDRLVNSVITNDAQKPHAVITHLRLFDIFTEMTGKRGPGPISFENDYFFMECYNTVGEQWAYHRANRSEEAQLQFFGAAENISEFGTDIMDAGNLYIQRRGIAHRVKGSPHYRRMVFYSREPWKLHVDPNNPPRKTTLRVSERILETAPWRDEAAQYLEQSLKR